MKTYATLKHATVILPVLALIAGCGRGVFNLPPREP